MEAQAPASCPASSKDSNIHLAEKAIDKQEAVDEVAHGNGFALSVEENSACCPSEEVTNASTSPEHLPSVTASPSKEMVANGRASEPAVMDASEDQTSLLNPSEQTLPTNVHPYEPATAASSPESPSPSISPPAAPADGLAAPVCPAPSPAPASVSAPLTNGRSPSAANGAPEPGLTEVDLLDDDAGAGADRLLPPSPGGSDAAADAAGASSPLSELSDDFLGRAASAEPFGGRPAPARSGARVDVELEAQLFNLTDRVSALTEEKRLLEDKLKRLREDAARLTTENGRERAHIDTLERQLAALRAELDAQREAAADQQRRHQEALRALELELSGRLSRTRAQLEAAVRDKDKMVLRYAQSEKSVIDAKREAAAADKRVKEALKEKDLLLSKVNHLVHERNRMSQEMETKIQESKSLSRDSGKMKEEIESRDVRIKWLQNKMKVEADGYKEGQVRMESLLKELRDAQETIRQYKLTEESRSSALDKELREEKARRLVEEKLKQDSTHKEQALWSQLQEQQERCSRLAQESAVSLERALSAESALEAAEAARARLQEEVAGLRRQVETLLHDSAELDEMRATLERERERLAAAQAEAAALQAAQADLQADLDGCHAKEADLLDFTQKLTEKNVELQSQISVFQARSQAAEFEAREFSSRRAELESRLADVTSRLAREQEARSTDNQLLTRRLAEKTHQVELLTKRAEDAENETAIVRKKQQSSVRELQRELAQARRRLESKDPSPAPTPADALSQASRASSNLSLHEAEPPAVQVAAPPAPAEPSRQALIERIVRLQRQVARRSEKIDFLEDHVNGLVEEVRRKSRLLQHYVLREEAGALASQHMDQAKTDLMRKGGIMASVYGSQSKDETMTLELSLEINRKLQTVLEDTLLKNMTLKDNMNVLGQEIASLTEENRRLKGQ